MTYTTISLKMDGPIARLTIERPDKLNALNLQVLTELTAAAATLAESKDIRVVVFCGSGEKAFIAGADIAAMKSMTSTEALAFARLGQAFTLALESLPQVVIAQVQGFALGGGCEMAMACDIIIASSKAKFGQPEVTLGLVPGFGGSQRLARRVGLPVALDLLTTSRMLSGQEAYQLGLISRVTEPENLQLEVEAAVKGVLKASPKAIAEVKRLARAGLDMPLASGLNTEAMGFASLFGTNEANEGMGAFMQKRPAAFSQ